MQPPETKESSDQPKQRIRDKLSQLIAPLTTRERALYGSLLLVFVSLVIAPRITADVGDVGSIFSVAGTQCSSDDSWLQPDRVAGQPSYPSDTDRTEFTNQDTAIWNGSAGAIECGGFPELLDHNRIQNAIGINLVALSGVVPATELDIEAPITDASTQSDDTITDTELPLEDELETEIEAEVTSEVDLDSETSTPATVDETTTAILDGTILTERIETRPDLLEPNVFGSETLNTGIDTFVLVSVSTDNGETWFPFHTFDNSLKASRQTRFDIALPAQFVSDPSQLAVKVETVVDDPSTSLLVDSIVWTYEAGEKIDIDTKLINADSGKAINEATPVLNEDSDVLIEIDIKNENDGVWQGLGNKATGLVGDDNKEAIPVTASLVNARGQVLNTTEFDAEFEGTSISNADQWRSVVDIMPSSADPGRYTLRLEVSDQDGGVQTVTQDFLWGVLALNTNKDAYQPNEAGTIDISVLDERGATICDADVRVTIDGPNGREDFSVDNGITIGELCEVYGPHIEADYLLPYTYGGTGTYTINLRATTDNGTFSIEESIEVLEDAALIVERMGPTRIYPVVDYQMQFRVTAPDGFTGTFSELLPISFEEFEANFAVSYDSVRIEGGNKILEWNLSLAPGESIEIGYVFDAPNVAPEFYLLGPAIAESTDGEAFYQEQRQWQLAGDALDVFRVTTYELQPGQFTGLTYDLNLNNSLSEDYFTMINGMSNATGSRGPGVDFARVSADPHANFGSSTSSNEITLTRGTTGNDWIGSVTIVECILDCATYGFELSEVLETSLTAGTANSQQTVTDTLASNHTSRTVPFGGHRGGGMSTAGTDANTYGVTGGAKLTKTSTNQLTYDRFGGESRVPAATTFTTYITEWAPLWEIQSANVTGTASGQGIDATSEYDTAAITSVVRDNTFVWASGFSRDDGLGDGAFGQAAALGNGVTQNATETTVAVGSEGGLAGDRDFEVYVLSNPSLIVDHQFKTRGDAGAASGFQELDITVDAALGPEIYDNASTVVQYTQGLRIPLFDSTVTGTGQAYSRSNWAYRHNSATNINYWRAYSGQNVSGWFQSVDLSSFTIVASELDQLDFRWRDDSTALNTSGGWLEPENVNPGSFAKGDQTRLRIKVANITTDDKPAAESFELQFAEKNFAINCSAASGWVGLTDSADDAFAAFSTTNIEPDGQPTTTGLLSNTEGYDFINGEGRDSADNTLPLGPFNGNEYTELEYAIETTFNAITGETYCFRVFNKTDDVPIENYSQFPEVTVASTSIVAPTNLGEAGTFSSAADGGWTTINFIGTYTSPVVVGTTNTQNGENALEFEVRNVTGTSAQMRVCESEGATANGCDTHASETVGYLVIDADDAASIDGIEAGTVDLSGNEGSAQNVTFPTSFTGTPYVFANTNTVDSTQFPISVVIRGTSNTQFNVNICDHSQTNENECDASHGTETVGWVAIDPLNSPFLEQNQLSQENIGNSDWTPVTFSPAFPVAPVVIVSSQTDNGGEDVEIDEARGVSTTGADIRFCEIDTVDVCNTHAADDVAWLAIEPGELDSAVTLDQDGYQIYENIDSLTPTSPISAEDSPALGVGDGTSVRVRMALQNSTSLLNSGQLATTLQYNETTDCSVGTGWNDVGAPASGTIWRFSDNATPNDGDTLPSSLLDGGVNVVQSYEEANDTALNPNTINATERGEWDFAIENNGATDNTNYCFRLLTDADEEINYSAYPQIVTASGVKMLLLLDNRIDSTPLQDNFDSGVDGSQWADSSGGASTGDCVTNTANGFQFEDQSGAPRVLESNNMDLTNGGSLSFFIYAPSGANETGECEQPEVASNENLVLEYSTDGTGTVWTTVDTYIPTAFETLTEINIEVPIAAQSSTTRFRWIQTTYNAGNFDHWTIDDVLLTTSAPGSIPSGWSCVSCLPSDPLYDTFIRGEATYGGTGGSDSHTHTSTSSVTTSTDSGGDATAGSDIAGVGHGHTIDSLDISGDTLPDYKRLVVIESDISAENVTTLPEGGIGLFSTNVLPTDWVNYSEADGRFARGFDVPGAIGGESNQSHTVTGTLGPASGATFGTSTPTALLEEDFDVAINGANWNNTAGGIVQTDCTAGTGNSFKFNNATAGTRELESIDLNVSGAATATFRLYSPDGANETTLCEQAEAADDLNFEYSTNGGASWTVIDTYDQTDYDPDEAVSVAIPAGAQTASTRFRWVQPNFSANNAPDGWDHWALDDIDISIDAVASSDAADAGHSHTITGTTSTESIEPPFIEVVLGEATIDTAVPGGMIAMFSGEQPSNFNCLSCLPGDPLYQRFFKAAGTYGGTGGALTHTHADFTAIATETADTTTTITGTSGANGTHTHNIPISSISAESNLPPYIDVVFASVNTPPITPTNLDQTYVDTSSIVTGDWTSEGTVTFTADGTDADNPDDIQLCIEIQQVGTPFTNDDTQCSALTAYTGSPVPLSVAIVGLADGASFHWQARLKDTAGDVSPWVSFGGNLETEVDVRIDTTAPTGIVYDGTTTDVDIDFNGGDTTQLSANWDIDSLASGLVEYETSIGTSPGATDVSAWATNGTSDTATITGLSLTTTQPYYFNVRTTDVAGNVSVLSSDGIFLAPTLSFTVTPTVLDLGNLGSGNSFTNVAETTLTTTTSAYNGYTIRAFATGLLENGNGTTIPMFNTGSYASPAAWGALDTGYGYTSDDSVVAGVNRFNAATCAGGGSAPCFAPFSLTAPGDIVADSNLPPGTNIVDEDFVITHRVTTDSLQEFGRYLTTIIYNVTARY